MAIETFVDLYDITTRLIHNVSISKSMGVAANEQHSLSDIAPRAPLLKFLKIAPVIGPCQLLVIYEEC